MKKLLTTLTITGAILLQSSLPAFAAENVGGQKLLNQVNHEVNQASKAANKQSNQLPAIIKRSNTMITSRIASLTKLLNRIQNDKRLSASEKTALTTQIQTAINGLNGLKTKIDADKDATTARSDEKSIITNYYVYAAFEPKVRYLIVLNNLQATTNNIQFLVPQLQKLVNTFKSQGKDVTAIQALLDDVSSQLTTINTTITSDITAIQNVSTTAKPADTTFAKVKQDISQIIKAGLGKIKTDFNQMKPLFKQLMATNQGSPTPSTSAVTTTPAQVSPTTSVSASPSTTP